MSGRAHRRRRRQHHHHPSGLLRLRTPPVYGLHEIVHNRQVVERLQAQGLVVVNTVSEAPEGATLHVLSPLTDEAIS